MAFGPSRRRARLRWCSPLAAVAAVVLLASVASPVPLAPVAGGAAAETQTLGLAEEIEARLGAGADVAPSQVDVEAFQLLGVSWASGPAGGQVRARTTDGWDEWIELDFEDRATPGSSEDANPRMVSEPIWVGRADGYQLDLPAGVDDVEVHLVRSGAAAPGQPVVLAASSSTKDAPAITSRSSWGPRAPKATPDVAPRLKMGFVHHTVSANDYAPGDVPAMLRGIQAYHMDANGWDDIGYNFLVDRAGQIWEGRSGGIDRNVVGAHVAGFNTGSVGVAVIGDHRTVAPTSASVGAVAQVLGWRLGLAGVDPTASATMTGPDGKAVSLRTVSGHRDAASTECPGQQLYDELGLIRSAAAEKAATVEPLPQSALPAAADIDLACPPGVVPGGRFSDVSGAHEAAIECLAWYGIATGGPGGRPPDQYGPGLSVPRGQMASFIVRLIDEADPGLLPAPRGDFSCPSDARLAVPADHPHLASIQRLAEAGVVEGGVGGAPANCYGPGLEVTRAQMAAFLSRATAKVGVGLGGAADYYADDDANVHEAAINAVSAEGIAQGTGDGRFDPDGSVRRDQMGSFLARTLNLFVEKDLAAPPA